MFLPHHASPIFIRKTVIVIGMSRQASKTDLISRHEVFDDLFFTRETPRVEVKKAQALVRLVAFLYGFLSSLFFSSSFL